MHTPIQFITEGDRTKTLFLAGHNGGNELLVETSEEFNANDRNGVLQFIASYILRKGKIIKDTQTMSYGVSMFKFTKESEGLLRVNDYNFEQNTYTPLISRSLSSYREQQEVCRKMNVDCFPPMTHQTAMISAGVYEGLPVDGTRMPVPADMSGWFLCTDLYNEDTDTLKEIHISHLVEKRPDLVKYLGLPTKFMFVQKTGDIWFEETIEDL